MCSIKFLEQNKIVSNTRVYKYIHQLYILPELRTKIHKLNDVENVRFWYVIWTAVMCVLCALDLLFSIYSLQADRISILSGYSYTCTLLYWHSRSETFKHTRSATYFQVIFASRLFPWYLQNSSHVLLPWSAMTGDPQVVTPVVAIHSTHSPEFPTRKVWPLNNKALVTCQYGDARATMWRIPPKTKTTIAANPMRESFLSIAILFDSKCSIITKRPCVDTPFCPESLVLLTNTHSPEDEQTVYK